MALKSTPTSFWKFNPRFYRGTRTNVVFREVYWILSFEFLAIVLLFATVLYFAIPESIRAKERRDREIERRRLEKLVENTSSTSPVPLASPTSNDPAKPPAGQKSEQDKTQQNTQE